MPATCTFSPCGRIIQAKGLCNSHYWQQWMGRPLTEIGEENQPKVVKVKPKQAAIELRNRLFTHNDTDSTVAY
jgi:hypothetical protein